MNPEVLLKTMPSRIRAGVRSLRLPDAINPGWHGVLGLIVLAGIAMFYVFGIVPEQERLDRLRRDAARMHRGPVVADRAKSQPEMLAEFYSFFPAPERLPDQLDRVFDAAKRQGLVLEHGEYRAARDSVGELTRYQIALPVRGTYPQIRKFVDGALADVSSLSLEGIQFERHKVNEPSVEAKVKLVVYLGRGS